MTKSGKRSYEKIESVRNSCRSSSSERLKATNSPSKKTLLLQMQFMRMQLLRNEGLGLYFPITMNSTFGRARS